MLPVTVRCAALRPAESIPLGTVSTGGSRCAFQGSSGSLSAVQDLRAQQWSPTLAGSLPQPLPPRLLLALLDRSQGNPAMTALSCILWRRGRWVAMRGAPAETVSVWERIATCRHLSSRCRPTSNSEFSRRNAPSPRASSRTSPRVLCAGFTVADELVLGSDDNTTVPTHRPASGTPSPPPFVLFVVARGPTSPLTSRARNPPAESPATYCRGV